MAKTISETLRKLIESNDLSQAALAEKAGVKKSFVEGILREKSEAPNVFDSIKIATALGISVYELAGEKDPNRNNLVVKIINMLTSMDEDELATADRLVGRILAERSSSKLGVGSR